MTVLNVNGQQHRIDVDPRTPLLYVLRNELKLNAAKFGCGLGQRGACTVLVDHEPAFSCILPISVLEGRYIRTVEGLETKGKMSPVQLAFHRHHALQCGYCTPGLLMTITAAWERGALPNNEADAREFLSGNLCRCTGYQPLVDVVLELAR